MLQILAEIYTTFPEAGDLDRPKLCLFIDEAHRYLMKPVKHCWIKSRASSRSDPKASVSFSLPKTLLMPDAVLSQLGLKSATCAQGFYRQRSQSNQTGCRKLFPISEYYATDECSLLWVLEAMATALNEKAFPLHGSCIFTSAPIRDGHTHR